MESLMPNSPGSQDQGWLLDRDSKPHPRGTKIVATVGPATDPCLPALLDAGVNVCRINFSHGTADEHRARTAAIRKAAREGHHTVAILGDLQGPKIRIGQFRAGSIELAAGQTFTIDTALPLDSGTNDRVGTT
jgi:pyruvate kinase